MQNTFYHSIRLLILPALLAVVSPQAFSATQIYSNTNSIVVNDTGNPPVTATPYPSTISVSNAPLQVISKVTVTLNGLSDDFPSDLGLLLMGPHGQTAVLMSEAGGQDQYPVTNLTMTLDDDAANFLPIYSNLTSGTFKPTEKDHPLFFDFPTPAPPGNSNAPAALSAFQSTDPNGTWELFVVIDTLPNSGTISNGWSLNFTLEPAPLQIVLADSSHNVVSWPATLTNCTLQLTHDLSAPISWQDVVASPAIVGNQLVITNIISSTNTFYRLEEN